ncbi:MAG: TetR/AcrR family transcriptional regulator [Hyphomicrobiales bacterium]
MREKTEQRRRGRPPKESSGHSKTREALLNAGVEILTQKGFSATGIEEILRKVNVPKGSFYHYFKSKEDFGAELIDRYAAYFSAKLDRILLNEAQTPLQRMHDFVEDAVDGMVRFNFSRGCLVGNLGQEMGALPPAYRDLLIEVFLDWQGRTAACLQSAMEAGQIPPNVDCNATATYFWIGWEGAVLRAKLEQSEIPLRQFAKGFFAGIAR